MAARGTVNEAAILSPDPEEFAANPGAEQISYRVTFERIGRTGGRDGTAPPDPLVARVLDEDGLAERIFAYARPYLRSSDVDVVVNLEELRGSILCGLSSGGRFTIERMDEVQP